MIKSKAEIRQVLIDYDQTTSASSKLFGTGKPVKTAECTLYKDLDPDGSPVVMNIEMNKEMEGGNSSTTSGSKKGGKKTVSGNGMKKAGGGAAANKKNTGKKK